MSKKPFGVIATVFLAAGIAAGQAWKEKPFREWDEKTVQKVLENSPWVRQVLVPASWRAKIGGDELMSASAGQPGASQRTGAGGGGSGGDTSAGGVEAPRVTFLVRWTSATTIRQALARSAVLRGAMKDEDVDKYLAQAPADYQIVLLGQDMRPFADITEEALKEKTFLKLKSSKQKLAPTRVEIQRSEDGKSIRLIVFHFAKKTEAGELTIPSAEKGVEFTCQAGPAYVQASFDLQKMSGKEGVEL